MEDGATSIGGALIVVVALRVSVATHAIPSAVADLATILIAARIDWHVATPVAVARGRITRSVPRTLVGVVASDRRTEIAKPSDALARVTVRTAERAICCVGVTAKTIGRIASVRDASTPILAGIRGTEIGVDTDPVLADPVATVKVARTSDVRCRASAGFTDRSRARIAAMHALRTPVALDAFANLVTETKGTLAAWRIDRFVAAAFTGPGVWIADAVDAAIVFIGAEDACTKVDASTNTGSAAFSGRAAPDARAAGLSAGTPAAGGLGPAPCDGPG